MAPKDDKSLDELGLDMFKKANFANLVNEMKANMTAYFEMIKISAEMRKVKYDALVKEGFTPEQALAIVIGTQPLG